MFAVFGELLGMITTDQAQFLASVRILGSGCWEWTGTRGNHGYGMAGLEGKYIPAHRAAHLLFVGPIPDGHHVDHSCRNRLCVFPGHLEAVTQSENNRRSEQARRSGRYASHCKHGHAFDEVNTRTDAKGHRTCRTCELLRRAARPNPVLGPKRVPNAAKTHCPKGHEFTPENTYRCKNERGGTRRRCKQCCCEQYQARRKQR